MISMPREKWFQIEVILFIKQGICTVLRKKKKKAFTAAHIFLLF